MKLLSCFAAAGILACQGSTLPVDEDPSIQGSYGAIYEPPQLVGPTGSCIRSIPHAVFSANDLGGFDLSVNFTDECVGDTGPEFVFGEVLILGSYTRQGTFLSFTPDDANAPLFTGVVEGEFIRLTLPTATGVGGTEVELVVGPREAF
jgi:hypothetical protein